MNPMYCPLSVAHSTSDCNFRVSQKGDLYFFQNYTSSYGVMKYHMHAHNGLQYCPILKAVQNDHHY